MAHPQPPPEDEQATPLPPAEERRREQHFWVRAALLAALGVVVVALLGSALLSISHAPTPHHVPIGYVGDDTTLAALKSQAGTALTVTTYDSRDDAVAAIGSFDEYGALIVTSTGVELLKSTASSPQVASTLTTLVTKAFTSVTPTVTDVTALPSGDSAGGGIGIMLQVVVLGGTIGSMGLGQLVPRYRANWARGELPLLFLILYALCIGCGVMGLARGFGVGDHVHWAKLTLCLALINLACTASISAMISIIGQAGAAIGGILYFLLGAPISGASTALVLMPVFWKDFGQALPPGAGATLLRRVLYFPEASLQHPLWTLGLYAGIGLLVLGAVNLAAGAHRRNSLTNLP
ncbi:ABC transporter permease [Actinoplanes sp. NPDC051851]|uniref:ABC transporter permease n=1 Tax=Actinoplanes sp. NPDC051851 TaxID=3154753 RepID=UPI00341DCB0F